jgi:hypothetical protein
MIIYALLINMQVLFFMQTTHNLNSRSNAQLFQLKEEGETNQQGKY